MLQKKMLMCSVIVVMMILSITNVNARDILLYKENSIAQRFSYDIHDDNINNSRAARIAVENFQYNITDDFNDNQRYADSEFDLSIDEFDDRDFYTSNNTYQSKKLNLTTIEANTNVYNITTQLLNEFSLSSSKSRIIIEIKNLNSFQFRYDFTDDIITNFIVYFDIFTRELVISSNLVTYSFINFIPVNESYEFLYLEIHQSLILVDYNIIVSSVAYNSTGMIIASNSTTQEFADYANVKFDKFALIFIINGINQNFSIVAYDNNFVNSRFSSTQYAIYNINYLAYDLKRFYLLEQPNIMQNINLTSSNTINAYATTLTAGRYLRYLTNTSYISSKSNIFVENYTDFMFNASFLMRNNAENDIFVVLNFSNQDIRINIYYYPDSTYPYFYFAIEGYHDDINFDFEENIFDYSAYLNVQFRDSLLIISLLVNEIVYSYQFYHNDEFINMNIQKAMITNAFVKSIENERVITFENEIFEQISTNKLTFLERIEIEIFYKTFYNEISIKAFELSSIFDNEGTEFALQKQKIDRMTITSYRSSAIGHFTITSDFQIILSLFNNNSAVAGIRDRNLLENVGSGKLYVSAEFTQSSDELFYLEVRIYTVHLLLYSDEILENNRLFSKIVELLVPFAILFGLILGFKSDTNSKYIAFIAIYIAIFIFYLVEYISLLFMIMAFVFQSIALYIIIKHEKRDEI